MVRFLVVADLWFHVLCLVCFNQVLTAVLTTIISWFPAARNKTSSSAVAQRPHNTCFHVRKIGRIAY